MFSFSRFSGVLALDNFQVILRIQREKIINIVSRRKSQNDSRIDLPVLSAEKRRKKQFNTGLFLVIKVTIAY